MGSGQPSETVISSLQYTTPSQLIPDTFSSALTSISVAQPPTSVPTCSCVSSSTVILTGHARAEVERHMITETFRQIEREGEKRCHYKGILFCIEIKVEGRRWKDTIGALKSWGFEKGV